MDIRMRDPHNLSRLQVSEAQRCSKTVSKGGRICNIESSLIVYIVGVSRNEIIVVKINQYNTSGRNRRRALGRRWRTLGSHSDHNQKCIGLRRKALCHAGRKYDIYPHTPLKAAYAHILAE